MGDERNPLIKVYDPQTRAEKAIASLRRQQKIISSAMIAVVIVVTIGFVAVILTAISIFIDHQDYAAERHNKYIELLEAQQNQINNGKGGPCLNIQDGK